MFMDALYDMDATFLSEPVNPQLPLIELSNRITKLCKNADRPIILMVDEVDRASNYDLLDSFLSILRSKFLDRPDTGNRSTFHSVIFAGVHNIKNIKPNFPWNIAAPFDVDMSFAPDEIATMLAEYEADHHTGMDIRAVSERLYYHTSGYPFLVSALCRMIHDKNIGWNETGVDTAAELIVLETNTLFDDIIKNIQEHKSLNDMIVAVLLRGVYVPYIPSDPDLSMGITYGIFKRKGTPVAISNRIFEKYIYEYMLMQEKKRNLPDT